MSEPEKIAPVQGYSAGIPWSMHLRAYDAYCKEYGRQDALIDLKGRNCRGGFSIRELDKFIPGWRDELSELLERTRIPTKAELAIAACGSGELCRDPIDGRQAGTCSLCGGVADRILALLGGTS